MLQHCIPPVCTRSHVQLFHERATGNSTPSYVLCWLAKNTTTKQSSPINRSSLVGVRGAGWLSSWCRGPAPSSRQTPPPSPHLSPQCPDGLLAAAAPRGSSSHQLPVLFLHGLVALARQSSSLVGQAVPHPRPSAPAVAACQQRQHASSASMPAAPACQQRQQASSASIGSRAPHLGQQRVPQLDLPVSAS